MRKATRLLHLTPLEGRLTPAVTVSYAGGALAVRGVPSGLLVVQHPTGTPANTFRVIDNGVSFGNHTVTGNLTVALPNRPSDVRIDLNGGTLPANVSIDLGTGYTGGGGPGGNSADLYDGTATTAPVGRVVGAVTIQRGNGTETFNVGA